MSRRRVVAAGPQPRTPTHRSALSVVLLVIGVAGCASPAPDPYAGPPEGSTSDTITLEEQAIAAPPFGAIVDMHVVATFEVLAGSAIDAWLTNESECGRFGVKSFAPAARVTGERSGELVADLPAGRGCLILDNADYALGRANATGNVTVRYRIDVWERV